MKRYTHSFESDAGAFRCAETGKTTRLSCWTNHARAKEHGLPLTPNSCEHCHADGDTPKSIGQRLKELESERFAATK